MSTKSLFNRRQLLKAFAAAGAGAVAAGGVLRHRFAQAQNDGPRFLICIPAFGGGAIIDSFLPIRESESNAPTTLDCFPDQEVKSISGSPIRAVDATCQSIIGQAVPDYTVPLSPFAEKHKQDMMVTTLTGTSVNHAIAQKRALSGGGVFSGRTLQELVALQYGEGYPMPNVNMASLGYGERGSDPNLPAYAYAERIPDPILKPLSLSAHQGIENTPDPELIDLARAMRNDTLDPKSTFAQGFRMSDRLALWKEQRLGAVEIEQAALIDKLIFVREGQNIPLSEYGLNESPDAELLASYFPDILSANPDPLEAQAALAFLLLKYNVSVTVTLAPSFTPVLGSQLFPLTIKTPPLAFDGSHNDHRASQAVMWHQITSIADRLIDLLKSTPLDDGSGLSMWDRTMIHFPTDFGRDKARPAGTLTWGTAHHLNNGHLTVSPLVQGNTVLGGVDPDTGLTYGFDLETGAEAPDRETTEAESFAGLAQALGIDTSEAGLPDVPAMRS